MKRCTDCGQENNSEELSCQRCGASLPGVQEPPPPGADPEAQTVVLRTIHSQMNAGIIAQHLEGAGIPVLISADDCGGLLPAMELARGIRLLVKASDLPRAEEALRDIEEQFGLKAGDPGPDSGVPPVPGP